MARSFTILTLILGLAVGVTGCSSSSSPSKPAAPAADAPGKASDTGARKIGAPQ